MSFEVKVQGGAELRDVRNRLRTIGDKGLGKQMGKGLRAAAKDLIPAVRAEAAEVMPKRGGYADILPPALRFNQRIKETRYSADVLIKVHADGKTEKRDIPRLNKGELRHPNVIGHGLGMDGGRFRRRLWTKTKPRKRIPGGQKVPNLWSTTKIRPGFVDRPFDRLRPQIVRAMHQVIDDVAKQIGA